MYGHKNTFAVTVDYNTKTEYLENLYKLGHYVNMTGKNSSKITDDMNEVEKKHANMSWVVMQTAEHKWYIMVFKDLSYE